MSTPIPSRDQLRRHATAHADHDYQPRWVGLAGSPVVRCSTCLDATAERARRARAATRSQQPGPPTGALIRHHPSGAALITAPSPVHGLNLGQLETVVRLMRDAGLASDALVLTRHPEGFRRTTDLLIQPHHPATLDQETAA